MVIIAALLGLAKAGHVAVGPVTKGGVDARRDVATGDSGFPHRGPFPQDREILRVILGADLIAVKQTSAGREDWGLPRISHETGSIDDKVSTRAGSANEGNCRAVERSK